MKAVLLISGAALAATPVLAQPAPAPKPIARADYIKSIDARFAAMDLNHDGKISRDELVAQQQKDLQNANAKIRHDLEVKFRQLDTNKDGKLSLDEFLAAAPTLRTAATPDQLLQSLDTNHDGKVSPEEFRAPELARFNKVDTNHDGIVTPDEIRAAQSRK
jgi:Ca2+-binding EF-hand superfamily protein